MCVGLSLRFPLKVVSARHDGERIEHRRPRDGGRRRRRSVHLRRHEARATAKVFPMEGRSEVLQGGRDRSLGGDEDGEYSSRISKIHDGLPVGGEGGGGPRYRREGRRPFLGRLRREGKVGVEKIGRRSARIVGFCFCVATAFLNVIFTSPPPRFSPRPRLKKRRNATFDTSRHRSPFHRK